MLDDGFVAVCTDGSAEIHALVGGIAGYGVYSEGGISISAPLPADFRQTINTAELYGAIQALRSTSAGRVVICTDSSYVYLGATGATFGWKARGWLNSAELNVPNVAVWEELLQESEKQGRTIRLVKLPSHLGIDGNSQADLLTNEGRLANPLNPPHQQNAQHGESIRGPPQKRRKTESGPSPCRIEFLSTGHTATLLQSLGLEVMCDLPLGHGDAQEWGT